MIQSQKMGDFEALKRRILKEKGFNTAMYIDNFLKRRSAVRLRATRSSTYGEYLRVLDANPQEYNNLINEMSINVTEFLRNPEAFKALTQ